MTKTISSINTHAWYRLLKVMYALIFLVLIFLSIFIIYSLNTSRSTTLIDNNNTIIDCSLPAYHTITASRGSVSFVATDFVNGDFQNFDKNAQIQDACGMTNYVNNVIANPHAFDRSPTNLFSVYPAYAQIIEWPNIIFYSFIAILIELALAEGIRRIFYYVVMGSVRPQK